MAFGDRNQTPRTMNRALRKHSKEQLAKAMEGDLVSDREVQQFQDQATAQGAAAIRGQQAQLAEQSRAAGEGTVQQQNLQQAAAQGQQAAASAGVQASGQAQAYKEGATQARRAEAVTLAQSQRAEDTRRRQAALSMAMGAIDVGGIEISDMLSLGGGGG